MRSYRHSTFKFFILFLAFIVLTSCEKGYESPSSEDASTIKAYMNNTQDEMQAPGWIVCITTPNVRHEYAGGKANLDNGTTMISSDLIRIGSISKTFTASLALILCDEGVLNLEDKLEDYYPGFTNADKISIRHLLEHRSGIPTWDENEEIRMQIFNGIGNWTIDKLIAWAETEEPLSEPGEAFHYSNIGYFLLGKILEQASGYTIDELLQAKICIPLRMYNTFMPIVPDPAGDIIHGYDESSGSVLDMTGTPQADAINFDLAWTAGGILSSVDDLSIWAGALSTGELLSDSLHLQQMPILSPPSSEVPYWTGYGMGVSQTDVWIGHTGAICGFICYMQHYVEEDVTIITFFNKFSAFEEDENAADLSAAGQNFMKLAKFVCPETL